MIDVMLIDDDACVRDYLREMIDWDGLGLRLLCEAGDGATARELYNLHHPRIVVTDINIPIISGLELVKEFIQEDKDLRIIVITGYGDFDSVRDSVSVGAVDLLSKPISQASINKSLKSAVDYFDALRSRLSAESAVRKLLAENQTLLQERCIANLFLPRPNASEALLRSQFQQLSLNIPGKWHTAVILRPESLPADGLQDMTLPLALKKLCDGDLTANGFNIFSFFGDGDRLQYLVSWSFSHGSERLEALISKLLEEAQFYFQCRFVAGIGEPVELLSNVHISAQQAEVSLSFRDPSLSSVINYCNLGKLAPPRQLYDSQTVSAMAECIRSFRLKDFQQELQRCCQALADIESVRELSVELLAQLSSVCLSSGLYPWNSVNYPNTIAQIFSCTAVCEVQSLLAGVGEQLMSALYQRRTKSKNQLIHLAESYIDKHLRDADLSPESVSFHVGLSKIYFCQLFHKEEGMSFNTYLTTERVALAKKLLASSNKKVYEISDEIGYSNVKYFNYVFKHVTGVTPLEYRKTYTAAQVAPSRNTNA